MVSQRKKQEGMIDTSSKKITKRIAQASATIYLGAKAFKALLEGRSPKGNVLEAARLAGIMAAKQTPFLIPMCHPIELNKVRIDFLLEKKKQSVQIVAQVVCLGRTGVEMEALAGCCVAALTVYDMMKWCDKSMVISDIKLVYKSGGKSGLFIRKE